MALYLPAKPSGAVTRYVWPIGSIDTASVTVTSGTAAVDSYETTDEGLAFIVSGGTTGAVTIFGATASFDGETFIETIYLPVIANTIALSPTGQDVAAYILRKVAGVGETADAAEVTDCLERVSAMLAVWKETGADIGVVLPLTTSAVFTCNDAFIDAIKTNGILAVSDLYEFTPSPFVIEQARRGLGVIKNALLNREPLKAEYY